MLHEMYLALDQARREFLADQMEEWATDQELNETLHKDDDNDQENNYNGDISVEEIPF